MGRFGSRAERVGKLYGQFLKKWKEISILGHTLELLNWDQEAYMPSGEAENRAEQCAFLAELHHRHLTDSGLSDIVERLSDDMDYFIGCKKENLREASEVILYAKAIPADLVAALAKETSLASEVWREARKNSSYRDFAPSLKKILQLTREKAAAYQAAGIGSSPYDALFSEYESCFELVEVDSIFSVLRRDLPPLVKKVLGVAEQPDDSFLRRRYPINLQEKLSREIATVMGFDWNHGRLDVTAHPFCCSPAYASVRITSRYDEKNFIDAFYSVMHEAGHGLYEQGLPKDWIYQPIGTSNGSSLHESQSRFWEAWFGRSWYFWKKYFREVKNTFPSQLSGVTARNFYQAVNKAKPGFVRVDSDLLTYNLHILLRYDIEKMMINENAPVDSLPEIWNAKFKEYFGIEVPDDRRGILQDIHWSAGLIGYFPTYALGNIISAQIYSLFSERFQNIDLKLACSAIKSWLRENIHRFGSFYSVQKLLKRATGSKVSASFFMDQLKKRYSDVYNISL